MEHFKLPNGRSIPAIGLGTWDLRGGECEALVRLALSLGYRHIDTAEFYRNEDEIGKALAASGIPREELFITSKVWTDHFHPPDFRRAAEESVRRLKLDYLDLLLIHWPNSAVPLAETMGALCRLAKDGKARSIGVSNFSASQAKEAAALATVPLSVDQVKFNLEEDQRELLDFAKSTGLHVTAYTPLGRGNFFLNPTLSEIARDHGKSPAQVALRWLLQQGVSAVPKTTKEKHLKDNLAVFDFALNPGEMAALDGMAG